MKRVYQRYPRAINLLLACIVAAGTGIALPVFGRQSAILPSIAAESPSVSDRSAVTGSLTKGTPSYDTVLPAGKTIAQFGGWTRVSPPNRDPVYAYADKVGAIPIIVSQQPLPKEFADQTPQQIQLLAQGYAANTKLNVSGAIAYAGTSAKGPQSVIVVKSKLLILIKASAAVPNNEWEKYIQSLS